MILLPLLISFLAPGFLASSASASIVPPSFRLPLPEVEKLPNGLTVAWFVDDKIPVVDLVLLVRSGTRNDPRGKSGTVEMTARMLERGAHGLSAEDLARRVESLGASGYANADEEGITIAMHGLSEDSGTLLSMMGWMAREPNFLPVEFDREKARLGESWRHLGDSAESVSGYLFGKAILNGTDYERGALDRVKDLDRLRLSDVRDFHRKNFVPPNSILIVVGRVDRKPFGDEVRSVFGSWSGNLPKKTTVSVRESGFRSKKGEILLADMPGLPQAQIRLGFRIPGVRSPNRYSLEVANALLGEYFNSRLNLVVRDRLGLAYGIQSSLTYYKDAAFFSIGSATAASNVGRLLEETIHQLRLVKADDVLAGEVETAKDYLIGGFPLGVSTLGAVATRWLSGYAYDLGPDYLNAFVPKIASVTRESVVEAIDEAFRLDRLVVVIAGDAKKLVPGLRAKGFKRFRKIPVKSLL